LKVTVLGAGSWGTTVASLAAGRNDTMVWARDADLAEEIRRRHVNPRYLADLSLPTELRATSDLEEAVTRAELLIVAVPSQGFRDVLAAAVSHVRPWTPIVSLTKGFESGTLLRMTEIVQELLPEHPAAAITGPNIAREIMRGQAAASVIATQDAAVGKALQRVLGGKMLRLYVNHDVVGCEMGGALKNVVALAAGMGEGLAVGDNTRAAVMTRGLAEISRLGVAVGGEPATFAGLTGMGDLLVTCISPHSRNRQVGRQLGEGRLLRDILRGMDMVAEGVRTAGTAVELADKHGVDVPICREIQQVVADRRPAVGAYRALRLLEPGHEAEPG
jgi:glycerol-3-phosphate dehydrogenase (NAD(P)+)